MVNKVYKNGTHVAVIYSPGFGAGWSTWLDVEKREEAVFEPHIVNHVEFGEDLDEVYLEQKYGYLGGLPDAIVVWVPVGTVFRIQEYDGAEYVEYLDSVTYHTA